MDQPTAFPLLRTIEEKLAFKSSLKAFARHTLEGRMRMMQDQMDSAQDAANGEDKSSAGDKYETSRAMNHLQKDMYARQFAAQQKELSELLQVNTDRICQQPAAGACIVCQDIIFFLASGLGKQSVCGTAIFFLSPLAPLAKQLMHKKKGELIVWNAKQIILSDIF